MSLETVPVKSLTPIQELESEIKNLNERIKEKETAIRNASSEQKWLEKRLKLATQQLDEMKAV